MRNVQLVPESRAAFLHAREYGNVRETGVDLNGFVLLIDIGSSTTDITVVRNLEEKPTDFGHNQLGCGLIDLLIFQKSLGDLKADERTIVEELFSTQPAIKAKCLLECRYAKEHFFSRPEDYWSEEPCERSSRLKDRIFWVVELYKKDIYELLSIPLEALGGKSWKEAFHNLLISTKDTLNDQAPDVIILTGGGAFMNLSRDICSQVFQESDVVIGFEPSLSIAKGLALAGKLDYKIHAFKAEINDFVESRVLLTEIKKGLDTLLSNVARMLAKPMMKEVENRLWEWRIGAINTLEDLNRSLEDGVQQHLKGDTLPALLRNGIFELLEKLRPTVEKLTADICTKYGIEPSAVSLNLIEGDIDSVQINLKHTDYIQGRYDSFESAVNVTAVIAGIGAVVAGMIMIVPGVGPLLVRMGEWLEVDEKFSQGMDKMREKMPVPVRKLMLSKNRFDTFVSKELIELEKNIKDQLQADLMSPEKLDTMVVPVKEMLYQAADRASLLIQ